MFVHKYTIGATVAFLLWLVYLVYDLNLRLVVSEIKFDRLEVVPRVILYNRIPKTGSTTFANIVDKLADRNHFWNININTSQASGGYGNNYIWPLAEQRQFLNNISRWTAYQPAIYHGHFGVIPVDKFLVRNPGAISYINLLRDPLERLVSYYYFMRYGDNFRVGKRRKHADDKRTINECIEDSLGPAHNLHDNPSAHTFNKDCGVDRLWMQIPFFCGQHDRCWDKNSRTWAYEMAVQNLYSRYTLVGTTDKLEQFLELLADVLPEFFEGVVEYLEDNGGLEAISLRQTLYPEGEGMAPNDRSKTLLEQTQEYQLEMKFYNLVKAEFKEAYRRSILNNRSRHESSVNYNKIVGPHGRLRGAQARRFRLDD